MPPRRVASSTAGTLKSRRRLAAHPWATLVLAILTAVALVESVSLLTGEATHRFLLWNLFLAWVPLPLALAAYLGHRRGLTVAAISPLLAAWLAFFPNAPYVVTDLIHFGHLNASLPRPLDLAVLVTAAAAGMLVGFASLYLVQRIVAERAGCRWGRAFVAGTLVLSSFGVYVGRVLRWNSWDAVTRPRPLLADIATRVANPLAHPLAWGGTLAFALFLFAAYGTALAAARRSGHVALSC